MLAAERIIFSLVLAFLIGTSICLAEPAHAMPKTASIIIVPSKFDGFLVQTGNVEVVFRDGNRDVWTKEGDCRDVHVSSKGHVGWIRIDKASVDVVNKTILGKDLLIVRMLDGTLKQFPPYRDNVSIEEWRFADGDTAHRSSIDGLPRPIILR